jgi:hypothetical protein
MFTLFARAARYASLTPAERAMLRLVEGLAYVALIGAVTACAQYLSAHPGASPAVDWQPVLRACAAGAAVAALMALAKYFKAHGDPALGNVLAAEGAKVAQTSQIGASAPSGASALAVPERVPGGVADGAEVPLPRPLPAAAERGVSGGEG